MAHLDLPSEEFMLVQNFLEAGVRFLVIGGYATKFYGCGKTTKDLDLLIDREPNNARKAYPVIVRALGYQPKFQQDELCLARKQLKFPNERVDILTPSDRIDFSLAWERRERSLENGVVIPVVSKRDLIEIKKEAAKDLSRREKEMNDIACLEKTGAA